MDTTIGASRPLAPSTASTSTATDRRTQTASGLSDSPRSLSPTTRVSGTEDGSPDLEVRFGLREDIRSLTNAGIEAARGAISSRVSQQGDLRDVREAEERAKYTRDAAVAEPAAAKRAHFAISPEAAMALLS